ncbi:sulfotransferase domain-containing protein [Sphingomonas canadensis]|uniref:Sulfotransferase domain-containing protein n=1 Tax=Sphingomonas canadensis TaxID=1219257 RepID=A0ABW3H660_9SPHN|nr:sulfotransferase domain-containing protein [Sphingomonas canadensis]MCW3836912.1 sulfotransferase domain-containing protein [Sphingomonas canadensis]
MTSIVWLASYPKSGSTWIRAFLTAYGGPPGSGPDLDRLIGGELVNSRALFDEVTGLNSADLSEAEIDRARPGYHLRVAAEIDPPCWVKVHNAFGINDRGQPIFPGGAGRGVVHIVRNPLDVAVSFAHHQCWEVDRIIDHMADPHAAMDRPRTGVTAMLPQRLDTWSGHAASWRAQTEMPVLQVRYEDMIADPHGQFDRILRFAGVAVDAAQLEHAIRHTGFSALQAREARSGFAEKALAGAPFFRRGIADGWRDSLLRAQALRIVASHRAMMARLGYLDAVLAFLDEGTTPA